MERMQIEILDPKVTRLLNDLAELNLISIQKKLSTTKAKSKPANDKPGIYPFRPQYLKFNNTSYVLREKLDSSALFEEGVFIISNQQLDISVWGSTIDEAEEAFAFAFHSMYENFAREDDKNLTPQAQTLKQTLRNLVLNTITNNEG